MFDLKPVDPLEELLSKARGIVSERAKFVTAIQENEASLSAEQESLQAAQKRVNEEEFQAAQAPGSLAVASKTAQQAVADAEVRVKTVKLRLKGLQSKLAPVEENLSAVRGELGEFIYTVLSEKSTKLGTQFDDAIRLVIRLFFKALALKDCCSPSDAKKLGVSLFPILNATTLGNPITAHGAAISKGFFTMGGEKPRTFNNHWREDPEAERLCLEIQSIKDRIAEFDGAVSEGQQA